MLHTTLARLDHPDYRLYVGTYPNDRATIDAVVGVAQTDSRIRLVIGDTPGPTTKGDCLNTLWRALCADERSGEDVADAIVLHDAEDVVHPAELIVFDRLIGVRTRLVRRRTGQLDRARQADRRIPRDQSQRPSARTGLGDRPAQRRLGRPGPVDADEDRGVVTGH